MRESFYFECRCQKVAYHRNFQPTQLIGRVAVPGSIEFPARSRCFAVNAAANYGRSGLDWTPLKLQWRPVVPEAATLEPQVNN